MRKDIRNKKACDRRILKNAVGNLTPDQLMHAASLLVAKGHGKKAKANARVEVLPMARGKATASASGERCESSDLIVND